MITVAELTHGVERAKTEQQRRRRQAFIDDLVEAVEVHPVTPGVAKRTGRLSGEEAARGITLRFEDLPIGATALELRFEVLTENVRDFEKIPGLAVKKIQEHTRLVRVLGRARCLCTLVTRAATALPSTGQRLASSRL